MRTYAALIAAMVALAAPATAHQPAVAPAPITVPVPTSAEGFRQMALLSNSFEIQSSVLALQRSRNPRVRQFAEHMARDHSVLTRALLGGTAMAGGAGAAQAIPAVPLDARHAAMLEQLSAARGRQFDRLYAYMQVLAHQEAIALFGGYAQVGRSPAMVAFARQGLPILQRHLALTQSLPGAPRT